MDISFFAVGKSGTPGGQALYIFALQPPKPGERPSTTGSLMQGIMSRSKRKAWTLALFPPLRQGSPHTLGSIIPGETVEHNFDRSRTTGKRRIGYLQPLPISDLRALARSIRREKQWERSSQEQVLLVSSSTKPMRHQTGLHSDASETPASGGQTVKNPFLYPYCCG